MRRFTNPSGHNRQNNCKCSIFSTTLTFFIAVIVCVILVITQSMPNKQVKTSLSQTDKLPKANQLPVDPIVTQDNKLKTALKEIEDIKLQNNKLIQLNEQLTSKNEQLNKQLNEQLNKQLISQQSMVKNTNDDKPVEYYSYLKNLQKKKLKPWHEFIAYNASTNLNSSKGIDSGAWTWCTHLMKYGPNFDRGLASFLAQIIQPSSVLEFGSGIGLYINYLSKHSPKSNYNKNKINLKFIGIEPESMLDAKIFGGNDTGNAIQLALNIFQTDYNVLNSLGKFDLVYSSEVAEHIPTKFLFGTELGENAELRTEGNFNLIDFLINKTDKFLVFGSARRRQGGTGHIIKSLRDREEWEKLFIKKGMIHLKKLSERLRDFSYNAWDKSRNTFVMITKEYYNKVKNIEEM